MECHGGKQDRVEGDIVGKRGAGKRAHTVYEEIVRGRIKERKKASRASGE